jgi:Ca2+-binding EF-hand superfamily protein
MKRNDTMKRITLLVAAIALGTAVTAYASGDGQPGMKFLESWDMNEDGQVTLAEATERRGDIFFTFDENEDGILSTADYAMFNEARVASHEDEQHGQGHPRRASVGMEMQFNDVDNDGQVSQEEFLARSADWFNMLDRNSDGIVTSDDFGRRS